MTLSAIVVLYNPQEDIFENICSYGDLVDYLIVVDNSDTVNGNLKLKLQNEFQSKLFYIENNENLGIATALNIGTNKAINLGSDWGLTMDQDSRFDNFSTYLNCFNKLENKEKIAVVSPNQVENQENTNLEDKCVFINKNVVMTSGNIANLKVFQELNGFEEKLFIDEVDHDYCLKAKLKGYEILKFENIFLIHTLGDINAKISTRKIKRQHNYIRRYYITRNSLFMAKKYSKHFTDYSYKIILYQKIYRAIWKIITRENNKFKKLKSVFYGIEDFLTENYGKFNCEY